MKASLPIAAILVCLAAPANAQASKSFDALLSEATRQVEQETGQRVAFVARKQECPANPVGTICHYRVGNSFVSLGRHESTGVRFFIAIRVEAADRDWADTIAVLTAFMEPDLSADKRREGLFPLFNSSRKGAVNGALLGKSVFSAGYDRDRREQWSAMQDEGLLAAKSPRP